MNARNQSAIADAIHDYLDATLEIPIDDPIDPHDDGPTVHVPPSAMRSYAVERDLAELPPASAPNPAIFEMATRRSPALVVERHTQRLVVAIWALAIALLATLGMLVYQGATVRAAQAAPDVQRGTSSSP